MKKNANQISAIIYKRLQGVALSQEEQHILNSWLAASDANRQVFKNVQSEKEFAEYLSIVSDKKSVETAFKNFKARALGRSAIMPLNQPLTPDLRTADTQSRRDSRTPIHRVHFLRTSWFRYAAVAMILFGTAAYLWNLKETGEPVVQYADQSPLKNDVLPGGNKAVLTLGDGSTIVLDSAANFNLAQQGASTIKKSADGQIIYTVDSAARIPSVVVFNTLSTPKGGEYSVTLPDGSRIWLNAASSITYPAEFRAKERRVSITGEAYFEVVRNPAKPFIVRTYKNDITVLGTSFNVNSYGDEPKMKTSLLEGSVQIGGKILKPGQAYLDGQIAETNVEQDMAWKNGVFNFEDKGLDEVMRQLARWYDLEVVYPHGIPKIEFGGGLKRDLNLSQILKVLESAEVHFQLEGHKLIVKP